MFKSLSTNLNIHCSFSKNGDTVAVIKCLSISLIHGISSGVNLCTKSSLRIVILAPVSIKNSTSSSCTVVVRYNPSLSSGHPISKALGLLLSIELQPVSSTNSRFPNYVYYHFFHLSHDNFVLSLILYFLRNSTVKLARSCLIFFISSRKDSFIFICVLWFCSLYFPPIFDGVILIITEALILKVAIFCSGHGVFHHFHQFTQNCEVFVYQLTCRSPTEQLEFLHL